MESKKLWKESEEKKLLGDCAKKIEQAVKKYESVKPPEVEDIFKLCATSFILFIKVKGFHIFIVDPVFPYSFIGDTHGIHGLFHAIPSFF